MDYYHYLLVVVDFLKTNWDSVTVVGLALAAIVRFLKDKSYKAAEMVALEMVRQVAVQQLSSPEKRKYVVDEVYKRLPLWAKKFLKEEDLLEVAEKAYLMLRGDIKFYEQGLVSKEDFLKGVDPTASVVDTQNLEVKSPYVK